MWLGYELDTNIFKLKVAHLRELRDSIVRDFGGYIKLNKRHLFRAYV